MILSISSLIWFSTSIYTYISQKNVDHLISILHGPLTYFHILKQSRSLPLVEYLSSVPDVFLLE